MSETSEFFVRFGPEQIPAAFPAETSYAEIVQAAQGMIPLGAGPVLILRHGRGEPILLATVNADGQVVEA